MQVQYHNRNPVDPSLLSSFVRQNACSWTRTDLARQPEGSIKYVPTLDELLATSDVVSLNLPLNKNTQGFFGKKQFAAMKKGAVLINTARGGVVDEAAMLEALASGQLWSAGLDVFPDEPHINPELLKNDKITLLPHMGTETEVRSWSCPVLDELTHRVPTGNAEKDGSARSDQHCQRPRDWACRQSRTRAERTPVALCNRDASICEHHVISFGLSPKIP